MRSTIVKHLAAAGAAGAVIVPAAPAAAADEPAALNLPLAHEQAVADPLHAAVKNRLVHRDLRLAHKLARLRGRHLHKGYADTLRSWHIPRLERKHRTLLRQIRQVRRQQRAVSVSPALRAIAACESGGNPRAIGGGGAFRGKYQFTFATWSAMGGHGDPARAPEAEQDRRAALLYARAGAGQWPVCGR